MITGFAGPGGGACAEACRELGAWAPRRAATVAATKNGERRDIVDPPRSGHNCTRSRSPGARNGLPTAGCPELAYTWRRGAHKHEAQEHDLPLVQQGRA